MAIGNVMRLTQIQNELLMSRWTGEVCYIDGRHVYERPADSFVMNEYFIASTPGTYS